MKIEDQVCSFEQAVKISILMENEPENETLFYWFEDQTVRYKDKYYSNSEVAYPAYNVSEIGVFLPRIIYDKAEIFEDFLTPSAQLWIRKTGKDKFLCGYFDMEDDHRWFASNKENLAESMTDNAIWLIKNNHLKAKGLRV